MTIDVSQYNYPLAPIIITPAQINTRITVPIGGSFQKAPWVEVNNESPYLIQIITFQGTIFGVQPQTVDKVPLDQGTNAFIIQPLLLLPQAAPSSQVQINVYPFGEPDGGYPYPLVRQSAPTSGAAIFGFSAMDTITSASVANACAANIFNPANSGKNYIFYSVRYSANDSAGTNLPLLEFVTGADTNLPVTLAANQLVSHNIGGGISSAAHITESTGGTVLPSATGIFEQAVYNTGTYFEFINFPDEIKIPPGTNLTLISTVTVGKFFAFKFLWKEQ